MPNTALVTAGSVLTATEFNYLPRGYVMGASYTALNQASVTTAVDLTSLSATFSFTSGRAYLIVAQTHLISTVADDIGTLIINIAGADISTIYSPRLATAEVSTVTGHFMSSTLSGSTTIKLRGNRSVGSGDLTYFHTRGSYFRVFDMGVA